MAPRELPNSSTQSGQADAAAASDRAARDRYTTLLDAEVGRLVHELRPFGVLRKEELAKRVHAGSWNPGAFEAALRAGDRRHQLERLPFGFVGVVRHQDSGNTAA